MSNPINGYYDFGLRALAAARVGLQVSGDNIANVNTPGFTRRRVDLTVGLPVRLGPGYLDRGVELQDIGRSANPFVQSNLEREKGGLAESETRLRGLQDIERIYGELGDEGLLFAYADFSNRFTELAGQPTNSELRRAAVAAADTLATRFNGLYQRLEEQQRSENDAINATIDEINGLSGELAELNRAIITFEGDGSTISSLRDKRDQVVERLSELTGGKAFAGPQGRLNFTLSGGPTLVSGDSAIAIGGTNNPAGQVQLSLSGIDVTARLREGQLGALIGLRDDAIPTQLADLDALARNLIGRTNGVTTSSTDLNGAPGTALFEPGSPFPPGIAGSISVSAAILSDPSLLAVSSSGAPDNGDGAVAIGNIFQSAAPTLGGRTPEVFLADSLAALGTDIVRADIDAGVSRGLVDDLQARRDEISGVSLDEEAINLTRYQQAYEAAAQFIQILNEISATALTLVQ